MSWKANHKIVLCGVLLASVWRDLQAQLQVILPLFLRVGNVTSLSVFWACVFPYFSREFRHVRTRLHFPLTFKLASRIARRHILNSLSQLSCPRQRTRCVFFVSKLRTAFTVLLWLLVCVYLCVCVCAVYAPDDSVSEGIFCRGCV
jgi:hypothetical protein